MIGCRYWRSSTWEFWLGRFRLFVLFAGSAPFTDLLNKSRTVLAEGSTWVESIYTEFSIALPGFAMGFWAFQCGGFRLCARFPISGELLGPSRWCKPRAGVSKSSAPFTFFRLIPCWDALWLLAFLFLVSRICADLPSVCLVCTYCISECR